MSLSSLVDGMINDQLYPMLLHVFYLHSYRQRRYLFCIY